MLLFAIMLVRPKYTKIWVETKFTFGSKLKLCIGGRNCCLTRTLFDFM